MLTDFLLVWQYRTCPVFIPDVSGICPAAVKLLFSGWLVGSSNVGQEFRRSGVPAWVGSSDVSHFNRLGGFTVLVIPDVSGPVWMTRSQRLVFKSLEGREFRRELGVPTVGSSDMRREFRHLTNLNLVTCFSNMLRVGSSDGREFRHSSRVPTPHIDTVT